MDNLLPTKLIIIQVEEHHSVFIPATIQGIIAIYMGIKMPKVSGSKQWNYLPIEFP